MSETGSANEAHPNAIKGKHLGNGIVKFPPNVHGIYVNRSKGSPYTEIVVRQNSVSLTFVLDDADCRHLSKLLAGD